MTANGATIANTTASFDATANVTTTYHVTITQTTSGCTAVGAAAVTVNNRLLLWIRLPQPTFVKGHKLL
jgi:hypothetical protein